MPVATCSLLSINGSKSAPWRPIRVKELPKRTGFFFDPMEDALAAFSLGEPIVVMDDESRENEGDIIISASKCTTEAMAWIIKYTRSVVMCFNACMYRLTRSKRIYLHIVAREAPRGALYSDDGSPKPRTAPHSVHRYRRL